MHLAFLGLGLVGGSIALAARRSGFASRITAWTPGGAGPRAAAADGVEASASASGALRGADLVVLAAPPLACLSLLDDLATSLAGDLAPGAVVTDVASTKGAIVDRARDRDLRFVGGHPMAGRETTGYGAADPDLFRDRPWILVPSGDGDAQAVERVEALATACGARPVRMSADVHDAAVASISHLPLLVSAALAETVTGSAGWSMARLLTATGWTGMTRLALGDPEMAAGILETNRPAIVAQLDAFRATLDDWSTMLATPASEGDTGGEPPSAPDTARIRTRFAAARDRLTERGEAE